MTRVNTVGQARGIGGAISRTASDHAYWVRASVDPTTEIIKRDGKVWVFWLGPDAFDEPDAEKLMHGRIGNGGRRYEMVRPDGSRKVVTDVWSNQQVPERFVPLFADREATVEICFEVPRSTPIGVVNAMEVAAA